jgi:selenocysteine lyase/cysteine desulfurase
LREAIGTLLEFGPDGIESHILAITSELIQRLMRIDGVTLFSPLPQEERAGIVTISLIPPLNPQKVFEKLRDRGATIAIREGKLRYSPHFYNSMGDMERVADMTAEAIRDERGG